MVTQTLVDTRIDQGADLLAALDAAGMDIPTAFWQFKSEWDEWRLVLAVPAVEIDGPLDVYRQIQDVMSRHPRLRGLFDELSVVSMRDERVRALRESKWSRPDPSAVRMNGWRVGGVSFEDAYLYRAR